MQISLRSHLIAGTTALVGATAIAVTPIAPTVPVPDLSSKDSAVALAALASPIVALVGTAQLGLKYMIDSGYSGDPVRNWGAASGIGTVWNDLLQEVHDPLWGFLPHITAVGVVPNFLQEPFPIGMQFVRNLIGYGQTVVQTAFDVLRAGSISEAISIAMNGLRSITADIATKVRDTITQLTRTVSELPAVISYHWDILSYSVTKTIAAIRQGLASGGLSGAWNAAVTGLLSPNGIPGTVLNLTIGAGVQTDPTNANTFVPSARSVVQSTVQAVASAMSDTAPGSLAPTRRVASTKTSAITAASVAGAKANTVAAARAAASTQASASSPDSSPVTKAPGKRIARHATK